VPNSRTVELYLHSPIRLHGIVLNELSTGKTLPFCLHYLLRYVYTFLQLPFRQNRRKYSQHLNRCTRDLDSIAQWPGNAQTPYHITHKFVDRSQNFFMFHLITFLLDRGNIFTWSFRNTDRGSEVQCLFGKVTSYFPPRYEGQVQYTPTQFSSLLFFIADILSVFSNSKNVHKSTGRQHCNCVYRHRYPYIIQNVPGGKVNILGGHSVGQSKQKK
jgi:hypothetical protein